MNEIEFLAQLKNIVEGAGDRPDLTLKFIHDEIVLRLQELSHDDTNDVDAAPEL